MRGQLVTRERTAAQLAAQQHGSVSRHQLLELGFGPDAVDGRISAGRLHAVHRGVYAFGHRRLSWHGRLMAAVLACGPDALLSHRSAAALWGLRATSRGRIEVTTAGRARPPGIEIHRTRCLNEADRTVRDGIPVTSVSRTLLDLAEVVPRRQLERAVDEAERRRLFDLTAMNELLARSRGRRGLRLLNCAIADATDPPGTRSELERRFAEFCEDAGLPGPAVNVAVAGYEVDAAWPKQQVVVELDSWAFHGGRLAFENDRERDLVLQLADYRIVRVTWRKLAREPDRLARELRRLLSAPPTPRSPGPPTRRRIRARRS